MLNVFVPAVEAGAAAESAGAGTMESTSAGTMGGTLVVVPHGVGEEHTLFSAALGSHAGLLHGAVGEAAIARVLRSTAMAEGGIILELADDMNAVNAAIG